jgi:N-acetylglutamate synthase-like GNAT family acetyltransferase
MNNIILQRKKPENKDLLMYSEVSSSNNGFLYVTASNPSGIELGTIVYQKTRREDTVSLELINVLKQFQGLGIGTILVFSSLSFLTQYKNVQLDAVFPGHKDDSNIHFFAQIGFKVQETSNTVLMSLNLDVLQIEILRNLDAANPSMMQMIGVRRRNYSRSDVILSLLKSMITDTDWWLIYANANLVLLEDLKTPNEILFMNDEQLSNWVMENNQEAIDQLAVCGWKVQESTVLYCLKHCRNRQFTAILLATQSLYMSTVLSTIIINFVTMTTHYDTHVKSVLENLVFIKLKYLCSIEVDFMQSIWEFRRQGPFTIKTIKRLFLSNVKQITGTLVKQLVEDPKMYIVIKHFFTTNGITIDKSLLDWASERLSIFAINTQDFLKYHFKNVNRDFLMDELQQPEIYSHFVRDNISDLVLLNSIRDILKVYYPWELIALPCELDNDILEEIEEELLPEAWLAIFHFKWTFLTEEQKRTGMEALDLDLDEMLAGNGDADEEENYIYEVQQNLLHNAMTNKYIMPPGLTISILSNYQDDKERLDEENIVYFLETFSQQSRNVQSKIISIFLEYPKFDLIISRQIGDIKNQDIINRIIESVVPSAEPYLAKVFLNSGAAHRDPLGDDFELIIN